VDFAKGDRVRLRSGGPELTVIDVMVDDGDGDVLVWCTRPVQREVAKEYYRALVLQPAEAETLGEAPLRPNGPLPGEVIENPRFGGPMTVCDRDVEAHDGSVCIWAQWFSGDEYGSGSFPLDETGRVVDYPPRAE
jgi:uncharacterized protein YodC (DUF2158 family)